MKRQIEAKAIEKLYDYLDKDPVENAPKLLDLVEKIAPTDFYRNQLSIIRQYIDDPNNNWYQLYLSLWRDIDPDVRRTLFINFVINANYLAAPKQIAISKKYDCNVPWTILIDPTSACNLHCTGCWAAEYGNKLNLSLEELDDLINQAKDLGIHMFLYSGGEPLVRKDDIITLCERHDDCVFSAFTNGTLIDDDFADEMLRVKNFVPTISVEGFEKGTDFRRGKGTFAKVERAMDILKDHKLPFGVSSCYTSQNIDEIASEEYFDWMVDKGAKFVWFFTYIPVGVGAPTDLLATAEQREKMYHKVREFRKTKPIFSMDFWNDGEYVGGCIAGGRNYLHVNANGDMEPCAFIHYSDSNIRDKTLLEALQSPLFMAYRDGQPFNNNHLRPCPLLDNPDEIAKMVDKTGAKSTDLVHSEDVHSLSEKCREVSERWAPVAAKLWEENDNFVSHSQRGRNSN